MEIKYKHPLKRKLNYEQELASTQGVNLSMLRWGAMLPDILTNISFNLGYFFNLALHLCLNCHFDFSQFDFNMPDFLKGFQPPFEKISKAKYGESKYGYSLYDPPGIDFKMLSRLIWDLRYQLTCEDALAYKHIGNTTAKWVDQLKATLEKYGVAGHYIDSILRNLSLVEGKMLTTSYWDFAAFDVNVFSYDAPEQPTFIMRSITDWKTPIQLGTIGLYECHFDHAKFDYARFVDTYGTKKLRVRKEMCDNFENRVKEFHARSGQFEEFGTKGLFQRVFFLERTDRLKWNGGKHQVYLQKVLNEVKRILNKYGILVQARMAYTAFAQELFYKNYVPHRRYKRYKQDLSDDDIVNKYINMGCDKDVLNEIRGVVTKWRPT